MIHDIPVPFRNLRNHKIEEREALQAYPDELLAGIFMGVGFTCNCCAKCCTRAFNGHVLLLGDDVGRLRESGPEALEPAFPFDFCDQNGTFYVSGYTLRSRSDEAGSCFFLENRRCRIYDDRPMICRIYPYMLHRESDNEGILDWRQISGLDKHGEYHGDISREHALVLARGTKDFEKAVLDNEIAFLEYIGQYFRRHGLRNVRKVYDDGLRKYHRGAVLTVMVYHRERFEPWQVSIGGSTPLPGS